MEIIGFGGGCEHTIGHIQLVLKIKPLVGLTRFHVLDSFVSYHVLLGSPWLHKHKLILSTYHQCIKGRLNGKPICIPANPTPFNQSEAHYLEAAFYDQLTISGEDAIAKPLGTPLPSWEDIKGGFEVNLRDLLERRKKRKEQKETTYDAPRCKEIQLPNGYTSYHLCRCVGPKCAKQESPRLTKGGCLISCYLVEETFDPTKKETVSQEVLTPPKLSPIN